MRILIVEDEKSLSTFLSASLKSECFAVDTAADGKKGLYLARVNTYDLVILDLILPKMHGDEVCRQIRKKEKNVPILILSVKSEVPDKVKMLNMGADDYLIKPFSFEELLARIRALLRRPKRAKDDLLHLKDLTIDLKKRIIRRGSKEVYLTRKEFMLLELLARHKNTVVTRASLIEHVWDMNADIMSNTIESHIKNLRQKIDRGFKKKLIRTVPGRGYVLEI